VRRIGDPGKTVDQDERGNAERRALFVGLAADVLADG
jgi:hypothetical protein